MRELGFGGVTEILGKRSGCYEMKPGNRINHTVKTIVRIGTTIYVQTVCLQTRMSKTELQYTKLSSSMN